MKLTEKQKQEALEKIRSTCTPIQCPMCKSDGFSLNETEYQITSFVRNGTTLDLGNVQYIPSVALCCNKCGYLAMFSLMALGIDLQAED